MAMRWVHMSLGALYLGAAAFSWATSENSAPVPSTQAKPSLSAPTSAASAPTGNGKVGVQGAVPSAEGKSAPQVNSKGTPSPAAAKPILGEAFIAQDVLRIFLNRPASISLYNARGQQVFHLDSRSPVEFVPLFGMNTGFLYLTVRSGQSELTKKLVYTGK